MVVAFMSRDYNLTNELPEQVFSGVPVVFVAVSELEIPDSLRKRDFSGIFQRYDISGTLGLIFRLQPGDPPDRGGERRLGHRPSDPEPD